MYKEGENKKERKRKHLKQNKPKQTKKRGMREGRNEKDTS